MLAAALVLLPLLWLFLAGPSPFRRPPYSLQSRIESGVGSLAYYRDRIEASMRLQFLESALVDGRRSSELRTDYRLIEEKLDSIIARMPPASGAALEAELNGLLPDLTRDRSAAARRLVEMQDLLLPAVGLRRQGDAAP